MKQITNILFLVWLQVDASQFNPNIPKDADIRGRHLISFSAFNKLITEGGAETASDGSSPTLAPVTLSASMEVRTSLTPTVSPTKTPTKTATKYPTSLPTDKLTTGAPTTYSPTDRPRTDDPTTSSPSTSTLTTSERTEPPSVSTTSEPTNNPTTIPATSNPTTVATPSPNATPSIPAPSSFAKEGVASTRTSTISLEIKGETASNQKILDSICRATQTHVNIITKRSFGKSTETTLDCDVSTGKVLATTVTKFPDDTQAPDAVTYDDFIHVVMISDETISTLPYMISEVSSSLGMEHEVKAVVDTSVHPTALQLSFEELHDSAVSMQSTFSFGAIAIMVAFFTVLMSQ